MEIKACKICGSTPVLLHLKGSRQPFEYICPKVFCGECKSTEEEMKEIAAKKWNDKQ